MTRNFSKTSLITAAAFAALVGIAAVAMAGEPHGGGRPAGAFGGPPGPRPDFSQLDANKDGKIDRAEFDKPAPDPFDAMDTNHDGTVSQAEFDAFKPDVLFVRMDGPPPGGPDGAGGRHGPHMRMMDPKALDANKDGKISFDEFAAPMKAHFNQIDANHDGSLSEDELKADLPPPPPPPMGR